MVGLKVACSGCLKDEKLVDLSAVQWDRKWVGMKDDWTVATKVSRSECPTVAMMAVWWVER